MHSHKVQFCHLHIFYRGSHSAFQPLSASSSAWLWICDAGTRYSYFKVEDFGFACYGATSPLTPDTESTPIWVCFLCSAHPLLPASNTENTSMLVCSLCSVLPVHPPFAPDTENTPMWVCSLVFSPPSSSLLVTALLGKLLLGRLLFR